MEKCQSVKKEAPNIWPMPYLLFPATNQRAASQDAWPFRFHFPGRQRSPIAQPAAPTLGKQTSACMACSHRRYSESSVVPSLPASAEDLRRVPSNISGKKWLAAACWRVQSFSTSSSHALLTRPIASACRARFSSLAKAANLPCHATLPTPNTHRAEPCPQGRRPYYTASLGILHSAKLITAASHSMERRTNTGEVDVLSVSREESCMSREFEFQVFANALALLRRSRCRSHTVTLPCSLPESTAPGNIQKRIFRPPSDNVFPWTF